MNMIPVALAALLLTAGQAANAGHPTAKTAEKMAEQHASEALASTGTIVEVAANAGQFSTLLAAAKAAGLVDALTGAGPLTVFAPTDDAFSALPTGTVASLLLPENQVRLATILSYHVVAGRIASSALAGGVRLDTLAGAAATITATGGGFNIDNARIVATDIDASNGVVHVIDRVILPPEQMTSRDALRVLERAIDQGVPQFNRGNAAATVTLYSDAMNRLLDNDTPLDAAGRARLERGLAAADSAPSASERAWQLRYAMDDVIAVLAPRALMAARRSH